MHRKFDCKPFTGSLAARIRQPHADGIALYWLGQAGFLVRTARYTFLIDPYLSDSLALKYRGSPLPHVRMMSAPITVEELGHIDLVFCTHHHTDHMDPGTLLPLASQPALRYVVPGASREEAMKRASVPPERLICVDAGDVLEPLPGLTVRPVRSAHETLQSNDAGQYVFLGYGIEVGGTTTFHSGDAVPFEGERGEVASLAADVALLPVNGRSKALADSGIPGNFFLQEATSLAQLCGIPFMLSHHYGMFDFNTIELVEIEREASRPDLGVIMRPALLGTEYSVIDVR